MSPRLPRLWLALCLAGLASNAAAQSAPQPNVQDPADRLLKEQRERERDERLQQQTPAIAAPAAAQPPKLAPDADPELRPDSLPEPGPAFDIREIVLSGNSVLDAPEVERIVAPFRAKRLGAERINLLLRRLTEAFIAHGYITTRAYLGEQNLASGRLELTVIPGRIEAIVVNGKTLSGPGAPVSEAPADGGWLTDQGTLAAFPASPGDTLRLQDLEQGVDQINRLRRNQAELQIVPGQTPGGSVVSLNNRYADRWRMNLGFDNYGSRTTGTTRTRLGLDLDNAIGLEESLSLAYVGSLDTNALLASAALPFGYNTFSYTASYAEFQNLINDTALLYGTTRSQAYGWNRVVERSRSGKASLDLTLALRESQREINNILLTPQKLSVLRLAWNRITRFAAGATPGNWTIELGLSRGLDAFGASKDADGLARTDAHSQFTKVDLSASLTLPVSTSWLYRGNLGAQTSRTGLFSSEQLYLGGQGTVRGLREGVLAGERGGYWRNEFVFARVPQVDVFGASLALQPYVFADAGRVELLSQASWKRLVGAGAGLRMQMRAGQQDLLAELLAGTALSQPAELGPKRSLMQASLTWTF